MNTIKRNLPIMTIFFLAAASLCACGGTADIPGSGDRAVSDDETVSAAAVSGGAADAKSDTLTLQISVGGDNKVTIPDPADTEGEVFLSLQEEMDYDGRLVSEQISKYREYIYADLSFAGFEREVMVTAFAIGSLTEGDATVAKLHFESTGKEKTRTRS